MFNKNKPVRPSKHRASKKGFPHPNKKLSKGELNHQKFVGGK